MSQFVFFPFSVWIVYLSVFSRTPYLNLHSLHWSLLYHLMYLSYFFYISPFLFHHPTHSHKLNFLTLNFSFFFVESISLTHSIPLFFLLIVKLTLFWFLLLSVSVSLIICACLHLCLSLYNVTFFQIFLDAFIWFVDNSVSRFKKLPLTYSCCCLMSWLDVADAWKKLGY